MSLWQYLDTAAEREAIRMRREAGLPAPWTDDPVLAAGKFCNVFRKHDKTSILIHRLLNQHAPALRPGLALSLRLINRHATLCQWRSGPLWPELERMVGIGINTNAYRLNTPLGLNSKAGVLGLILNSLGAAGELDRLLRTETSFKAYQAGQIKATGVTSFIAYQAALDLRDIDMMPAMKHDWAYIGPGAVRGLLRVHDREVPEGWQTKGYRQTWMLARAAWVDEQFWVLCDETRGLGWGPHETQGWLCEFDKYMRKRARMGLE